MLGISFLNEWPVPACWSHCSTANDTKAKTSLIMTEKQPFNTPNSDQAVKPRKSVYQVTIRVWLLPVEDTAGHSLIGDIQVMDSEKKNARKNLKLLFSAPNTADYCPSASPGPYCTCLHISLHGTGKRKDQRLCLFIYMVMLSRGTLFMEAQAAVCGPEQSWWLTSLHRFLFKPAETLPGFQRTCQKQS